MRLLFYLIEKNAIVFINSSRYYPLEVHNMISKLIVESTIAVKKIKLIYYRVSQVKSPTHSKNKL